MGRWKKNGSGIYSYPDGGQFSGNFVDGLGKNPKTKDNFLLLRYSLGIGSGGGCEWLKGEGAWRTELEDGSKGGPVEDSLFILEGKHNELYEKNHK